MNRLRDRLQRGMGTMRTENVNQALGMSAAVMAFALIMVGCAPLLTRRPPLPENARLVFEDNFSEGLKHWVSEGVGQYGVVNGKMLLDPRVGEDYGGYQARNVWCKRTLPTNFRIELDVLPLEPRPEDNRPCNMLFAFCANMVDAEKDVLKESPNRTAHYIFFTNKMEWRKQYGEKIKGLEIPAMYNYTISYYRLSPAKDYKIEARRNPGYNILLTVPQEQRDVRAVRRTIVIEKVLNSISFFENGRPMFNTVDDGRFGAALEGGYFCVRAFQLKMTVDNVKIYELR